MQPKKTMARTPAQRMIPPMKLPGSNPPLGVGFGLAVVAGLVDGVTGGLVGAVDGVAGGVVVGASGVGVVAFVGVVAGSVVVAGADVVGAAVDDVVVFGAAVDAAVVGVSVVTVVTVVGFLVVVSFSFVFPFSDRILDDSVVTTSSATLLFVGLPLTVGDTVEKKLFFTYRGKMK